MRANAAALFAVAALVYTMALHFAGWHSVLNGEGLFNSLTGALAITLAVLLVLYHLALFPRPQVTFSA